MKSVVFDIKNKREKEVYADMNKQKHLGDQVFK